MQIIAAPGPSRVAGQFATPVRVSATAMPRTLRLPMLVTVKPKPIRSPASAAVRCASGTTRTADVAITSRALPVPTATLTESLPYAVAVVARGAVPDTRAVAVSGRPAS